MKIEQSEKRANNGRSGTTAKASVLSKRKEQTRNRGILKKIFMFIILDAVGSDPFLAAAEEGKQTADEGRFHHAKVIQIHS